MAIKNFGWNFVGWVDLENVGFEGAPIDSRHHTPEYLSTAFRTIEELADLMDPLGYDALYSTEHHFQPEGIEVFANLQMLFLHLANRTTNLRFGTAFNISPQWHPLRLAEDYAMADILTRGRVIFGVGRGSQTREMETLGAPMLDQVKNRALFQEQVEILLKAFHEEKFSYHGEFYTIPPAVPFRSYVLEDITLAPRPIYSKDIWQPIASARREGLEFQVKNHIKGLMGYITMGDEPDSTMTLFRDLAAEHGRDLQLGEDLGAYLYCHLGDNRVSAARDVERFQEESFKRTAGIGGSPTDKRLAFERDLHHVEMLKKLGDPATSREAASEMGYESLESRSARDKTYLFGSPETVIATLKEMEERYPGLETVVLHPPELTHRSIMLEQIEWFAKEVMPAFPDAVHKNRVWPDRLADESSLQRYADESSLRSLAAAR